MNIFNLSLDDFCPHPRAGLDFDVIETCDKLIEQFPQVKINLFVPAAFKRLGKSPCFLSEHPEWVRKVNSLPNNYRINLHGYYHSRESVKHGRSNNDEWQYLSKKEATIVGRHMLDEFDKARLKYTPTFRPPGWKISRESVQALENLGIKCFAGDEKYRKLTKDVLKVKWVNYNWDLLDECKVRGSVMGYGHTSNWCNNYFNEECLERVVRLLNSRKFEFGFIEEM